MSVSSGSRTPKAERDRWSTPEWLFQALNLRYGFQVDLAADASNHKRDEYLTESDDALRQDWSRWQRAWLNPPYSDIGPWMRKAGEHRGTTQTVMLIPAPNGEAHYRRIAEFHASLYLIHGRIGFVRPDGTTVPSNTRGSCLVVFGPDEGMFGWIDRDAIRRESRT